MASNRRCWGCGFLARPPARRGVRNRGDLVPSLLSAVAWTGADGGTSGAVSQGQSDRLPLSHHDIHLYPRPARPPDRRAATQASVASAPLPLSSPSSSLPASFRSLLFLPFHRSQSLFREWWTHWGPRPASPAAGGLCELDPGRPGSHQPGPQQLPGGPCSLIARLVHHSRRRPPHPQPAARPRGAQPVASARQPGPGRRAGSRSADTGGDRRGQGWGPGSSISRWNVL